MRRAIVGLGNPGLRYRKTRHNVGFMVVDAIADRLGFRLAESSMAALWGASDSTEFGSVLLAKPQGYMNRSGETVRALVEERGFARECILVAHDDLDLPLGRIKLKRDGGTAGHRGLESIVQELGGGDFPRLRIGIGRPPAGEDVADFVLGRFPSNESTVVADLVDRGVDATLQWLERGIDAAMNLVNAHRPPAVEGSQDGC